jgi:hypothetical protein
MIDRQQVNLRLERDLIDQLDDLAKKEQVDRTEIARRILVDGVARARTDRALRDYAAERVTAWKAAEDAGVSLYEMLDRIHEAQIPYRLDPDEFARIDADTAGIRRRVAEERADYPAPPRTPPSPSDTDAGIDQLRERYRPVRVARLFVGESSPAQGTHFYRANSNLYRATRAAFAAALGEDAVPRGEAFLLFFRDQGCWLVDLADGPVNHLPDSERRAAVERGIERLAETIRRQGPAQVICVKRDIADAVRRALATAGAEETPLVVLPFPVRQWTRQYEAQLAAALRSSAAPRAG